MRNTGHSARPRKQARAPTMTGGAVHGKAGTRGGGQVSAVVGSCRLVVTVRRRRARPRRWVAEGRCVLYAFVLVIVAVTPTDRFARPGWVLIGWGFREEASQQGDRFANDELA